MSKLSDGQKTIPSHSAVHEAPEAIVQDDEATEAGLDEAREAGVGPEARGVLRHPA